MRHICYVTGTRADFGLLAATLLQLARRPGVRLTLVATGLHLATRYGRTLDEIRAHGFEILATVPSPLTPSTGATMARAIAAQLHGFTGVWSRHRPDIVVVLGDRGEMLAGATAAVLLGIPVAHLHGGERSGTIDESFRHAISKLSHYHLVASHTSRERLVRLGERPGRIFVTGAPGLDALRGFRAPSRERLWRSAGLDPHQRTALVVLHPVVQEHAGARHQCEALYCALRAENLQVLWLAPNADAGSDGIRQALARFAATGGLKYVTHLPRTTYLAWLASADILAGNSSSGIIEAATFGTPVVNVGTRQNARERNANVFDATWSATSLRRALQAALARGRRGRRNVYGDGRAAGRICRILTSVSLRPSILMKLNAY